MSTYKFFGIERANLANQKIVTLKIEAMSEKEARCTFAGRYVLFFNAKIVKH